MTIANIAQQLAPEWILLIGACVVMLAGLTRPVSRTLVGTLGVATILAALGASLTLSHASTPAEVLPGVLIDSLTHYVRWLSLGVGVVLVLVSWHQPVDEEYGEYMSMVLLSLLGVLLTASANDLLVLFFAIELVSIPTYVLIALSRTDARASESAVKYFFLGALSAAILAYGFAFLYGSTGTTSLLTMQAGRAVPTLSAPTASHTLATIGLILAIGGLLFKIAAVPFHVYAADVYEGAAAPITGLLGFVPKLAGFVALCRLLAAFQWQPGPEILWLIWIVAAATMTVGNVLGLLQRNVKRMLAYSSIAHSGYMLVAVLVGQVGGRGPLGDGVASMLFYVAVYGVMNLGTFAVLSCVRIGEREADTLDDLAGLARRQPAAALALSVCVFSLIGLPPTAGFVGKLYVFGSAFSLSEAHPMHDPMIALAILGVLNAAVGAAYYLRIVATVYMDDELEPSRSYGGGAVRLAVGLCALPLLLIFAWPGYLRADSLRATTALRRVVGDHSLADPSAQRPTELVAHDQPRPAHP